MAGTQVIVDIDENGDVKVDVDHHQGKSCKKHLDAFRKGLGTVVDEGTKPEYFRPESNQNLLINHVGNR